MAKRLSVVPLGCPLPTYIKEEGREDDGQEGRAKGGVLLGLLVQVGYAPPFLSSTGGKGRRGEGEGRRGRAPTPCPIWIGQRGARATSRGLPPLLHYGP